MPEVGAIKRGFEIGLNNTQRYIKFMWVACPICSRARWVQLKNGKPRSEPCYDCRGRTISKALKGKPNPKTGKRINIGNRGERNINWKGGRTLLKTGYVRLLLQPDNFFYPMADHHGQVFEHRLVMAQHLKRCLVPWEVVHHRNGIKDDNRLENLELLPTRRYHLVDIVAKSQITMLQKQVASLKHENRRLRQQAKRLADQ